MNKKIFIFIALASPLSNGLAQDPNCMWGENDILCQSSRMAEDYKGLKSGEDHVREIAEEIKKGFSYQNPYDLDYDPISDECVITAGCDMTAKGIAHYNWLHKECVDGNKVACKKLQAGAYTPAPSDRYPDGGRMNVPYAPGTEPVPSVDPFANIRSAP